MGIRRFFAALSLGFALAIPAVHASPQNPENIAELVSAVKQTYSNATSVRADFVQVVRNKALGTEDRQRGKIAFEKPRKVRVEMGVPVQQVFVSDGKTLWAYSVKDKQVMETPDAGGQAASAGIPIEDLARIDELFNVTLLPEKPAKPSHTIQLVPKKPGAFKSMQLTLSKQKYVLQDLVLVDQLDNVTEMSFSMVRMNQDIPDSEFTFTPPAGVQVLKAGM